MVLILLQCFACVVCGVDFSNCRLGLLIRSIQSAILHVFTMEGFSVAILASRLLRRVRPQAMDARSGERLFAMNILGLQPAFTESELRHQYHRCALRHHPDRGGDTYMMQLVVWAHEFLRFVLTTPEAQTTPQAQAPSTYNAGPSTYNAGPSTYNAGPSTYDIGPPSPAPSVEASGAALIAARDFIEALGREPRGSSHRGAMRSLLSEIRRVMGDARLPQVITYSGGCLELMATYARQTLAFAATSWVDIGFKELSRTGYDLHQNRVIDYGNWEYLTVLEFFALCNPDVQTHLNTLREGWPTYMDLWPWHKSEGHVEQLADVIECIMGGLRGEPWFSSVPRPDNMTLPEMFQTFTALCKLVHRLDGLLRTGRLKYLNNYLCKLAPVQAMEFTSGWINAQCPLQGLLLFALFRTCG